MAEISGIELQDLPDGTVGFKEGYEVKPSPYDRLNELLEMNLTNDVIAEMRDICNRIPDHSDPTTYMDSEGLKLWKKCFHIVRNHNK